MARRLVLLVGLWVSIAAFLGLAEGEEGKVFIAVSAQPPYGGVVSGGGLYQVGATVRLEAEPNPGFEFVAWEEEGEVISESPVLEFVAQGDRDLTARFAPLPPELKGRFEGEISLLPAPSFKRAFLELTAKRYLHAVPFTFTSRLDFSASGWRSLSLRTMGKLGSISANAGISFDPLAPAYRSAYVGLVGNLSGFRWNLRAQHSAFGGVPPGPYLLYTLTVYASPLSLTLRAEDGADGLAFKDLVVRASSLPFCEPLGLKGRMGLAFTKEEGFSYLNLDVRDLVSLCCDISLDLGIKFTADEKEVTLRPRWKGLRGCLTFYGNPVWDEENHALTGFELYGYKIRCCFNCNLCPGARVRGPYIEIWTDTRREEFEYWKFGFCGPACCGGYYTLEAAVYFSKDGGLFGISRIKTWGAVPIQDSVEATFSLELKQSGDGPELDLGWRRRF
ncbi:MAG: Alpha-1,6-glucosidase, pullulanase-type [Acetothermia bacterium 64_32]|nr:MAG: Alpha-1,6-glucosidase, pullulanase-type [Acetothermia bacterium 64_32]HAF69936.1 hypothetical protein [Candidatus Acetothermia bacterium]